jgi:uncharacterized protein (DUF2147 family)
MRSIRLILSVNGFLISMTLAASAWAQDYAGDWNIPGEKPGSVDATITVTRDGDLYQGVLKSFTLAPGDPPDPRCDRCPPPRKGQPLRGLQILWGLKPEGDKLTDGYLLDPVEGKVYRVQFQLAEGGKALNVRMYLGLPMLGNTETWRR